MNQFSPAKLAGISGPVPAGPDLAEPETLAIERIGDAQACCALLIAPSGAIVAQLPNRLSDDELRFIAHCFNRAHRAGYALGQADADRAWRQAFAIANDGGAA